MRKSWGFLAIMAIIIPFLFLGCGSDGSDGATGPQGPAGPPGPPGTNVTVDVRPESCEICHNGHVARNGVTHQEVYDDLYQDGVVVVTNLAYANDNVSDIVTFNMTKAGLPFDCREANVNPDALLIYFAPYTGTGFQFVPTRGRLDLEGTLTYDGAGGCTSTKAQSTLGDLRTLRGHIAVFGRNEALNSDQASPELRFTRVSQNRFPFAAILDIGPVPVDYISAANVAGCEKCHTVPFLKHGYIYGLPGGVPGKDFYVCKSCHLDDGTGGHYEWQFAVNDPPRWAEIWELIAIAEETGDTAHNSFAENMTPAELTQYGYKTRLMNDVHMSHSMEFPFPHSMANCATCHEGKLGVVLTDANFKPETCLSCHPETGPAPGTEPEAFFRHRAPALRTIAPVAIHGTMDFKTAQCNLCHSVTGGFTLFSEMHTGYDKVIFAAADQKYSDVFKVTIDNASFAGNILTFGFHATESPDLPGLAVTDIAPTVLVGLYGFDTKDFYIGPHERDFDDNGDGVINGQDGRDLEYVLGVPNPRFTTVSAGGGSWVVTANLAAWDNLIANGAVKRLEIAVLPTLVNPALPAGDNVVALDAPSRTFDLGANAFDDTLHADPEDSFLKTRNSIVSVKNNCNNCHIALATTFHAPNRGGNHVVCRMCHIVKDGGFHLEMQSRSLDSWAHAIHSFQYFDIFNVDFTDPVQAKHYEEHTRFSFPTFGRTNCLACHTEKGKFNVPDQSRSLPGVISASYFPIVFPDGQRNIREVPSYIAGPAARACGGCHRVNWIKDDDAVGLAAFYSHVGTNGYLVETTRATEVADWFTVTNAIMETFK